MTLVPLATAASAMNFFRLAVVAMAWTIAALFLALRFFFTVPIVWAIALGLAVLLYAMIALVSGTLRAFLGRHDAAPLSEPAQRAADLFQRFFFAGTIIMLAGIAGQLLEDVFKPVLALQYFWLGLLVCGLVIQLYAEAAYLRNRG